MAIYIVLLYFAFSFGVFVKLKHYGAPNSSILYAGLLPIITFVSLMRVSYKIGKKSNLQSYKKVILIILIFIKMSSKLTDYTGLLCAIVADHQIGVERVVKLNFTMPTVVLRQVKLSFLELSNVMMNTSRKTNKDDYFCKKDGFLSRMTF